MTCSATRTFMLSLRNGIIVLNSECLDIISSSVGNLSPSYFLQIFSSSNNSVLPSKVTEKTFFDIPLTENKASSHDTMFSSGYIRNHIGNLYLFNRIHPFLSSLYIPMIHQILQDISFFPGNCPALESIFGSGPAAFLINACLHSIIDSYSDALW